MIQRIDVCGFVALARLESLLRAHGYRRVDGRVAEAGEYRVDHGDAAPGWSEWMYEVEVIELPGLPLRDLVARVDSEP